MEVIKTSIDGVVIIEPRIFRDERGYFFESFSQREFDEKVGHIDFVQDNESMSVYGVMRGLHFQRPPYAQSKLVRCVRGKVMDVAVDIRAGSPTYGKYVAVELSGRTTGSSSFRKALRMDFPSLAMRLSSNTNATISITRKRTEASASWTTASASTGKFLPGQQS